MTLGQRPGVPRVSDKTCLKLVLPAFQPQVLLAAGASSGQPTPSPSHRNRTCRLLLWAMSSPVALAQPA